MKRHGFTLIELLVTVTIMIIIGVTAIVSLSSRTNTSTLNATTQQIATLLRQAQNDSMAQNNNASWGVHLDNTTATTPFYTLFYTTTGLYSSSTQAGRYSLPSGICFSTSTLSSGSSLNIIFNSLNGAPSASATITLTAVDGVCGTGGTAGSATSVVRTSSGKVFFDDFTRTNL